MFGLFSKKPKVKPVSFSEAVLLGCRSTEQAFGNYVDGNCYCVLGAAHRGLTGWATNEHVAGNSSRKIRDRLIVANLESAFPVLRTTVECPDDGCKKHKGVMSEICDHLNEFAHWSREEIATWAKGIEDKFVLTYRSSTLDDAAKVVNQVTPKKEVENV